MGYLALFLGEILPFCCPCLSQDLLLNFDTFKTLGEDVSGFLHFIIHPLVGHFREKFQGTEF